MSALMRWVFVLVVLWLVIDPASARTIDRKALKQGMTLPEVVQMLGQPDKVQWMNANGQAVLVAFFETEEQRVISLFKFKFVGDTVKGEDGRRFLPLGFMHNGLVGWGNKFYEQLQPPK